MVRRLGFVVVVLAMKGPVAAVALRLFNAVK